MATTRTLQLSDGRPEGVTMGQSATDLVGFYGATAVAQPAQTLSATTALTATVVFSEAKTGMWAFGSSTVAAAYVTRVRQMQADLETLMGKLETLGLLAVTGN